MSDDVSRGRGILRVLIIEASGHDADLVERALSSLGRPLHTHRVYDERGLHDALAAGPWDLVLCRHDVPGLDAGDALRIVDERDRGLPFILVPGDASRSRVLTPLVRRSLEQAALRREHQASQDDLRQLAAIVESSRNAIISRDLSGVITSWNKGAERLYGWSAAEAIGQPHEFLVQAGRAAEEAELLTRAAAGESIEPYETRRITNDGRILTVSLTLSPIRSGDEVVAVSSIARDITAQREAEAALRESETRYRMLLEHLPGALVLFFDLDMRIMFVAGRLLEQTGWDPDELVGARVGELLPHGAADPLEDALRNAFAGRSETLEVQGVRNPELVLSYRVVPVKDEDGTTIGGMMLGREVAAERRFERELRAARELFEDAFENAPIGMAMIAAPGAENEGQFIRVNRALAEIAGLSEEELLTMSPSDITHPDDRTETDVGVARMLRGEVLEHMVRKRYVRPNGDVRWVVVRAQLVHDSDGKPLHALGVIADVHSQVEAEEESQRLEAMLHQAQKLEGIGQLAGGIAHDFNNLLAVILNYVELAQRDELLEEALCEIDRAARRAAELTKQLLVFSRQEVAQPVVLDLNLLVEETQNFLLRTIGEDIQLCTELHAGELAVRADKAQLEQTLINLAVNARDAMPGGGRLQIETRCADLSHRAGRAVALPGGRYAEIRVADTGTGMSPDVLARVFEPFYTTKERGQGTGLGLAMVYGIATGAGGTVLIDSEPGEGTTVRVLLPHAEAPVEPEHPDRPLVIPPAHGRRVLVAEDEDSVRRLITRILAEHGYDVVVARDGEEALALAEQGPPVDTLLTDIVMPGMKGTTLARQLIARMPDLHVVFMTGYTDRPAQIPPNARLVLKPFRADELLRQVGASPTEAARA
jgi:two-component system cell cycle sensor histidine kinase/response regulator CckA